MSNELSKTKNKGHAGSPRDSRRRASEFHSALRLLFSVFLMLVMSGSRTVAQSASAPTPVIARSSSADLVRAEAESGIVEIDRMREADARSQFYFNYVGRFLVVLVITVLFMWAFPQLQEFNFAFGGGTFGGKRAPKEPPLPVPEESPAATTVVADAERALIENLPASSTKQRIIERLSKGEVYRAAGVSKDTVYVCHRARKIARTENYRVRIYLDADDESILDKVEKINYFLHSSFRTSEVVRTDRADSFALEITAWGEFMLIAKLYFKATGDTPVELKRYLNL